MKFHNKGVDGCCLPGIYNSGPEFDDDKEPKLSQSTIVIMDVVSMFPSLICSLGIRPKHLNESFNEIYGELLTERFKALKPHTENKALSESLKRGLNAIYGKFASSEYWLYDPTARYKVVVASQIFMCLFMEKLVELDPEIEILIVNTDCVIAKTSKPSTAKNACQYMTNLTGLDFKFDLADKITILDGNNYLLEDIFNAYGKGCFDLNPGYAKSTSNMIVPIALKEYFRYDKPLRETIVNHKNIYDFCAKHKIDKDSMIVRSYKCKNQYGEHYFMTQTNDYPEPDYDYYIKKASLIVSKITQQQQTLF